MFLVVSCASVAVWLDLWNQVNLVHDSQTFSLQLLKRGRSPSLNNLTSNFIRSITPAAQAAHEVESPWFVLSQKT